VQFVLPAPVAVFTGEETGIAAATGTAVDLTLFHFVAGADPTALDLAAAIGTFDFGGIVGLGALTAFAAAFGACLIGTAFGGAGAGVAAGLLSSKLPAERHAKFY
jgi:hypothetical protein